MKTIIPIDIVTLGDNESYHLFISGFVNHSRYELLIDTGASHTIFDTSVVPQMPEEKTEAREIESAGIHAGELKTSFGLIDEFCLGELKLINWVVVCIDLSHVNSLYKKYTDKRVAGLIGSDFLLKYKAIIDYKKRELVLRSSKAHPFSP